MSTQTLNRFCNASMPNKRPFQVWSIDCKLCANQASLAIDRFLKRRYTCFAASIVSSPNTQIKN